MNRALRREWAVISGLMSLGLWCAGHRRAAGVMGLGALGLYAYPGSQFSLAGKIAVITGGSRGLGLALAEELLREEALVILLARDADELGRANALLESRTQRSAVLIPCDVTRREDLERAFGVIRSRTTGLDLVINNAGSILLGPLEKMGHEDFDALLKLQVHAVLDITQLALPLFHQNSESSLVNICSVGGKIAMPHLSAYCTAKFALAGLSAAMGSELAERGVRVTTVFPGLMRTGSPDRAVIKGNHEQEYAWFATGNVSPLLSISAAEAARRIVQGIRQRDREITFPSTTVLASLFTRNFPETTAHALSLAARFFPKGGTSQPGTGRESRDWLEAQSWYQPLKAVMDSARHGYNQS